jgi:hypothetical protein
MGRVLIDLIRWNKETDRTASYNAHIAGDSQAIPAVGDTVIVLAQDRKRKIRHYASKGERSISAAIRQPTSNCSARKRISAAVPSGPQAARRKWRSSLGARC